MTPKETLDMIQQLLESIANAGLHVARIPEGIAVIQVNGAHVLIRCDRLILEVVS